MAKKGYNYIMKLSVESFYKRHIDILNYINIFLLSICVKIIPFLLYGNHPLGYDTGFYRRYLIQPFTSFPNTVVPGLGTDALIPRILFDTLRFFHLPIDIILYGSLIFFASILPCLLYAVLKKRFDNKVAIMGALFLIFSPIQYTGFWFMLWKNIFALNLLFLAFVLFEKSPTQKYVALLFVTDILIGLSHTTTSLMYLGTLGVFFLLTSTRRTEIFFHAVVTSAVIWFVHLGTSFPNKTSQAVGVFIEWNEYLTLSFPFILLALFGIKNKFNTYRNSILGAFILLTILFPLFHFPFYERIFLFTDIAVIILAATGFIFLLKNILPLSQIINHWKQLIFTALLLIVAGNILGNLTKQINNLQPLVKESNIASIQQIAQMVGPSATILTSVDDAPWYEGFSTSHIAAPGLLNDVHNFDEWNEQWNSTSTENQIHFLSRYPRPLFISSQFTMNEIIGEPAPCITKITNSLWRVECSK